MEFNDTDEPIELGEPDELPMYNQAVNKIKQLEAERATLEADCDFANCRASECAEELSLLKAQRDAAITAISEEGRKRGEVEVRLTALVGECERVLKDMPLYGYNMEPMDILREALTRVQSVPLQEATWIK